MCFKQWVVHWARYKIHTPTHQSDHTDHVTLESHGMCVNTENGQLPCVRENQCALPAVKAARLGRPGGTREHGPTGLCPPQVARQQPTTQRLLPGDGA